MIAFTWAKSFFPVHFRSAAFFFYAALILFLGFDLIPNFLPVPEIVFNVGGIALVFLVDWALNYFFTGYTEQGTVQFEEDEIRLISVNGMEEHCLPYREIYRIQVLEGIPLSLFYFLNSGKTVIAEVVFKDARTMKFECVKRSRQDGSVDLETCVERIRDKFAG